MNRYTFFRINHHAILLLGCEHEFIELEFCKKHCLLMKEES